MPPKSNPAEAVPAAGDSVLSFLTAREQTIMLHSLLTIKGFPAGLPIDYGKVAERMGLQNPRSVSNAWTIIKRKIADFDKEDRKRKGLPSEDEAEDDEAGAEATGKPTPKRARTRNAKGAAGRGRAKVAAAPSEGNNGAGTPKSSRRKRGGLLAGLAADDEDTITGAGQDDENEDEDEDEMKRKQGMIKLERVIDENGVESFLSHEI